MKRSELEHLIRAAGCIANDGEIVVIGSQSILGQFPDAPAPLLVSAEADLYPLHHPELADLIDGSIGEGSASTNYTATTRREWANAQPSFRAAGASGWRDRLVRIENPNTLGVAGLCLEVHDLAISKHVAGREKDFAFTRELAKQGMTDARTLSSRLRDTQLPMGLRKLIEARIRRDASYAKRQ